MQVYCDELVQQSEQAQMNINSCKTKEMLIGSISKDPPPHLMLSGATVDRVTKFKLLGIRVSSDLKWADHVDAIVSSATSLSETAEASRRSSQRPAALLHCYSQAGPRVCFFGLALGFNCWTV